MELIVHNCEYFLFTKEDPIAKLVDDAKEISLHKRWKAATYIRRAIAAMRKCKKFRDIITSEESVMHTDIGTSFIEYFDAKVDSGKFIAIPNDVAKDYVTFLETHYKSSITSDKYMEKITKVILYHSDYIDAFVKAFLSIRLAQGELDKLKSN